MLEQTKIISFTPGPAPTKKYRLRSAPAPQHFMKIQAFFLTVKIQPTSLVRRPEHGLLVTHNLTVCIVHDIIVGPHADSAR